MKKIFETSLFSLVKVDWQVQRPSTPGEPLQRENVSGKETRRDNRANAIFSHEEWNSNLSLKSGINGAKFSSAKRSFLESRSLNHPGIIGHR